MTRPIVLCADDFGMSPGVSRGILELAQAGRISAASAMVVAPDWATSCHSLGAAPVGVGLHLTLTWGSPLGAMPHLAPSDAFPSLGTLLRAALTGRLPIGEIEAEIGRQLDAFTDATGREPAFVDGHQHVHVLPGIRRGLLRVLAERGLAGRLWLRDPFDRPGAILVRRIAAAKALTVAGLSLGFGREARRAGFTTNRGFSGFSPFDPVRDVGADFARFLAAPGPAHLVMCHPGHVAKGEALDGMTGPRRSELHYLGSDAFTALLRESAIQLVPDPG